jgi:UPF0755 protein
LSALNIQRKILFRIAGLLAILGLAVLIVGYDQFMRSTTTDFETAKTFHLYPTSSLEDLADSLSSNGIIRKKTGFVVFGKLSGWGDQIKAGHYEVEPGASNKDILNILRRGLQTPVHVRVPAGTRKERMIRGMAKDMAFSVEELTAAFADVDLASSLGTDTTHLWASMVPDTYFFYWLSDPEEVISRIRRRYDGLFEAAADSLESIPWDMNADEVIRLAGIVEWESSHVPEKPTIAGVYLNRLRDRWALQADPTVQYALMLLEGEKRRLFFKDYKLNHPYNTYKFRGLPPGPITNPTLTSIQAVLYPTTHSYYYFVAKGDGQHIFSRTLAEHRRNAQEYYRLMRERRAAQAAAKTP